jgi:hypothetical protein
MSGCNQSGLARTVLRLHQRSRTTGHPVPDEIWAEAVRHYNESEHAALGIWTSMTNVWRRITFPPDKWPASGSNRQRRRNWSKAVRTPVEQRKRGHSHTSG